jgi:hypothetical protein
LYEDTLRAHGIDPEELVRREEGTTTTTTITTGGLQESTGVSKYVDDIKVANRNVREEEQKGTGVLVVEGGKSRYLENTLWTSLQNEFRDPKRILEDSSDDEDRIKTHHA